MTDHSIFDGARWEVFGQALVSYFGGRTDAELLLQRDDGHQESLPVRHFFRNPSDFTGIECAALEHCKGHVLDVGAGTGIHSLSLQKKGFSVTAIEICPQAVTIMKQRGVDDVHCADIFTYQGGSYDTILLLGHGIGMVETIAGLDRFLTRADGLLAGGGHVLLDSVDVQQTDDPCHLAYQQANRREGRYFGEIRLQFEFEGGRGPACGWLHVDPRTLKERAGMAGLQCEVLRRDEGGDYLAMLTRQGA